MARTGGHKALVPVTDAEWRAFHVLVVTRQTTIAAELARLVRFAIDATGVDVDELGDVAPGQLAIEAELAEHARSEVAVPRRGRRRVRTSTSSSTSARSATRPRSSSPAKPKANTRSSKPKKERPTR